MTKQIHTALSTDGDKGTKRQTPAFTPPSPSAMAQIKRDLNQLTLQGVVDVQLNVSMEKWKRDDAAWFRTNPTRSFRLRRIILGEWKEWIGNSTHSLVRQIEPGFRDRIPIYFTGDATGAFIDGDSDAVLMVMWRSLNEGLNTKPIPMSKIADGIRQMMMASKQGGKVQ
jgi:hypothetical protein